MTAHAAFLPDDRLHLQHGPIDLILAFDGTEAAVGEARRRAMKRFDGLLEELVAELPALRAAEPWPMRGEIARAMAAAVAPFRPAYITPMAAVAGAVADAVLRAAIVPGLSRAHANNGGDIALHLAAGQSLTAAIATDTASGAAPTGSVTIHHEDPVRGIATSGWRGRSFSLGIADAVTVLAPTAAMADAAATMIANAVDLPGHRAIGRRPACDLKHDSDLGRLCVTVSVGQLSRTEVATALERGLSCARSLRSRGLIAGAALFLQRDCRSIGPLALSPLPENAHA